jgi:hypothetical protein
MAPATGTNAIILSQLHCNRGVVFSKRFVPRRYKQDKGEERFFIQNYYFYFTASREEKASSITM